MKKIKGKAFFIFSVLVAFLFTGAQIKGSMNQPNTSHKQKGDRVKNTIEKKIVSPKITNSDHIKIKSSKSFAYSVITIIHKTDSSLIKAKNMNSNIAGISSESVTDYEISQNYPNPFNPETKINFAIPEAGQVTLHVYSQTGQLVKKLVGQELQAGRHQIHWNGTNSSGNKVANGVYIYRVIVQNQKGENVFNETRRMTLLK